MMDNYPPVAFYFTVEFDSSTSSTCAFKEVSGLTVEREIEVIQEGGCNGFEYKLPKHLKHTNLVLKRGLLPMESNLEKWITQCVTDNSNLDSPLALRTITIKLLTPGDKENNPFPLYQWECTGAYVVKYEISSLDSEKNEIVIDTMELAYKSLSVREYR
jgi:phage tail-like protein